MSNQTQLVKAKRDRLVKIGFFAAVVVVGASVWLMQREPGLLQDWQEDDLPSALAQASAQNKQVLVLFYDSSATSVDLMKGTLSNPQNLKAMSNFIRVKVRTSSDAPAAAEYKLEALPAMLILSPKGEVLNRRHGSVGEVEFRQAFLSLQDVKK